MRITTHQRRLTRTRSPRRQKAQIFHAHTQNSILVHRLDIYLHTHKKYTYTGIRKILTKPPTFVFVHKENEVGGRKALSKNTTKLHGGLLAIAFLITKTSPPLCVYIFCIFISIGIIRASQPLMVHTNVNPFAVTFSYLFRSMRMYFYFLRAAQEQVEFLCYFILYVFFQFFFVPNGFSLY